MNTLIRKIRSKWKQFRLSMMTDEQRKAYQELSFWKSRAAKGPLANDAYVLYFLDLFALPESFYAGKKILDIGCGPRGSLEWADMAAERIGLDPLANSYLQLGADKHKMKYVNAPSENIPFEDRYFDIVTSINSLDHVDNLEKTINEIIRVVTGGGYFLLLVEVNHKSRICEPQSFSWDILEKFTTDFDLVHEKHVEITAPAMKRSIEDNVPYDHSKEDQRPGFLCALLQKKE